MEMNRTIKAALLSLALVSLASAGMVLADKDSYDDDDRERRGFFSRWSGSNSMAYNSQDRQLYEEECGSCHFPFQPGFLPADSWQRLMEGLEDHFDENAELSDEKAQRISAFLLENAADRSDREISSKVMWSLRNRPAPIRITETAFFQHEHEEIPARFLTRQEPALSFVNCDSCHTRALQGSYREREIRIPGIGRWDD
jgi:hypothetical protein